MKSSITAYEIADLSPHLFWDVSQEDHEWEKNKKFIIHRVLEYGLEKDWQIIKQMYSLEEIKLAAITSRSLDEVAMHFIATITNTPIEKFRCYKHRQLIPHYSGY